VTTFLLVDDAVRSPELRHELGEPYGDPVVFLEHDGRRIVAGPSLDEAILSRVADEFWPVRDLGAEELVKTADFPYALMYPELARRALDRLGARQVRVPGTFPVLAADHLRDAGIEVAVDPDAWTDRRRVKRDWELEGITRAQRAAAAAIGEAARLMREATPGGDGGLRSGGETLTAERIRDAMVAALLERGAESEEIMIQPGDQCLDGHEVGSGPIRAGQSVVIDCFPRDRRSGLHSDMTRTFVAGTPSPELRRLHEHARAALDVAFEHVRPGAADAHAAVAAYFAGEGFPTQDRHEGEGPLREGFMHGLGHGVGLEVHEQPWMGRRSDALVEGDVVAVEPGLYFPGIGGVRLEDTVRVTASGPEHFDEPYPYDLEP
jgi:Xaa-Pro aminopeptidase